MSRALIRAALESRVATWAAARVPSLPIAWENAKAAPALPYLRVNLLAATTDVPDLAGVARTYRGLLQVTVVAAIDTGPGAADGIVGELEALFPANLSLASGGITVRTVGAASAAPALQDDTSYRIPVSIPYRADTP